MDPWNWHVQYRTGVENLQMWKWYGIDPQICGMDLQM
jgi:hypothetical protein